MISIIVNLHDTALERIDDIPAQIVQNFSSSYKLEIIVFDRIAQRVFFCGFVERQILFIFIYMYVKLVVLVGGVDDGDRRFTLGRTPNRCWSVNETSPNMVNTGGRI